MADSQSLPGATAPGEGGRLPAPLPLLDRIERALMALTMGLLCLITLANVVVRYFTDISFAFTEEISVWLLVVMTLVGASHAFVRHHHIAIAFFVERRGPAARYWTRLLGYGASLLAFAALTGLGARMAWDDYQFEVTSPSLDIPQWLYTVWLPLLSALVVVRLVQRIVAALRAGREGV
ncbi:TRAP transporter small permease [Oryzomicrobium sp.]|uniref:TRAP transporter small permease n=1 Tax=Oryzomicrobium sp. TaxID=1911578 RepID=UPI002FE3DAC4